MATAASLAAASVTTVQGHGKRSFKRQFKGQLQSVPELFYAKLFQKHVRPPIVEDT